MDLTTLTDEELDGYRTNVLKEVERRANLAAIPAQVAALAQAYTSAGGDPADLTAAIN